MANRELMYYKDYREALNNAKNRTFLIQVVIFDKQGRVWVARDPDGGKLETHIAQDGTVFFPNTRQSRFNAVSGGIKKGEEPLASALREMQGELGGDCAGAGVFNLRDDLPLFLHGHEKGLTGYLSAVLIAEYHPSDDELERLSQIGNFRNTETLLHRFNGSLKESFRPAFSFALELLEADAHDRPLDELVAEHDQRILTAMVTRTWPPWVIFQFPEILRGAVDADAQL